MLFVYTSTNPCNCNSSSVITDPPCEDACNCLNLCAIPIPSNSSGAIEPCGGEKILDLTDAQYEHDTCACGENDQKWYISYFDPEVFESVTVSLDGELNAITVSTANEVLHSNIIVRFVCGNLSAYLTIVLGIANECSMLSCGPTEVCNRCSGTCEEIVDIGTE